MEMKILVVTGDEKCKCKGTGIVTRVIISGSSIMCTSTKVNTICTCVKAKKLVTEEPITQDSFLKMILDGMGVEETNEQK